MGGDRFSGYDLAEEQLFCTVDDVNPNEDLRKLEEYVMENDNKLKKFGIRAIIGKGGMGPKTLAALQEHSCISECYRWRCTIL